MKLKENKIKTEVGIQTGRQTDRQIVKWGMAAQLLGHRVPTIGPQFFDLGDLFFPINITDCIF